MIALERVDCGTINQLAFAPRPGDCLSAPRWGAEAPDEPEIGPSTYVSAINVDASVGNEEEGPAFTSQVLQVTVIPARPRCQTSAMQFVAGVHVMD